MVRELGVWKSHESTPPLTRVKVRLLKQPLKLSQSYKPMGEKLQTKKIKNKAAGLLVRNFGG